jgi:hypothetical protein
MIAACENRKVRSAWVPRAIAGVGVASATLAGWGSRPTSFQWIALLVATVAATVAVQQDSKKPQSYLVRFRRVFRLGLAGPAPIQKTQTCLSNFLLRAAFA